MKNQTNRKKKTFFAEIEKLDDDAKLALLESIKLPGDEENASENVNMEETEPIEAEVEDEAKKMLEKHKQRLTIKGPALKLSYQRIPIEDDGRIDVQEWFDVASSFIQQAREKGEAVLIHCREGRSRSVTMTIAYLMIGLKMTLKDAMVRVKEVILDENINFGFKTQLMALDLRVHGFNSIDYASKRRRNTTINTDYSDSLSEATGAPRRSKRTRKTKKSQAEEGDEEYDATTQELAPPVKVKATTSSISKSRPSTASSTEAQPSTSSAPIDEHRPDSTPADMMAVDEHVDIETVPDQTASNLPNKTPSTDAMDVDVEVKSEPAANEASTGQKPDSSLQASQKPKPQSSPAPKKETATAEPKKSKTATSSANTPTKGKKKAAQIPVQKNTLFNYFGKK
jgi:protein-tyrosine phosphatase